MIINKHTQTMFADQIKEQTNKPNKSMTDPTKMMRQIVRTTKEIHNKINHVPCTPGPFYRWQSCPSAPVGGATNCP
jgi:hypothetical protein